jgi:hypothetical protein
MKENLLWQHLLPYPYGDQLVAIKLAPLMLAPWLWLLSFILLTLQQPPM